MYSAPSNTEHNAVCKEVNNDNLEPKCFATHIIPGDEEVLCDNMINRATSLKNDQRINVVEDDETAAEEEVLTTDDKAVPEEKSYVSTGTGSKSSDTRDHPKISTPEGSDNRIWTSLHGIPSWREQEYTPIQLSEQELMFWHYRLGHMSFARIQNMAKNGELPSR